MPTHWTNIRLPRDLHARIVRLAEEMLQRHADWLPGQFIGNLPCKYGEDSVPWWWVIERAMKEFEDHRRRSSRSAKKRKRHEGP